MEVGSVFTEGIPDYSASPAMEVNNDFITQK